MRSFGLALASLLVASPAMACGGFFSQTGPMDQAGEKVVFGVDGDRVTAIIQIQYQGDAKEFAWIIPVPAQPALSVASDEIFTRLGGATKPTYQLKMHTKGTCKTSGGFLDGLFGAVRQGAITTAIAPTGGMAKDGVSVVERSAVGPYDSVTLTSDDPEALKTWLEQNHYNIPDAAKDLIAPYVQAKNFFVALKLRQDKSAGDLQPIVLKMTEQYPCVPIRLTAIAATPHMPLTLWVFGKGRAIPKNYRHVVLNEALIDWFGAGNISYANYPYPTPRMAPYPGYGGSPIFDPPPAPNYDSVVTQSMIESGGNGWVTEFASASAAVGAVLSGTYNIDALRNTTNPFSFMRLIRSEDFPTTPLIQTFYRKYLPAPAGFDEQAYWNTMLSSQPVDLTPDQIKASYPLFDPNRFADDLDATYNKPLADARGLVASHPYLTRFYTTMSAAQMTVDPIFTFHPGMNDISNVHTADAETQCSADVYEYQAPVRVTLATGQHFTLKNGDRSPIPLGAMPAALAIEQLFEDQVAQMVQDNLGRITSALMTAAPDIAGPGCACANPLKAAKGDTGPADREAAFWGIVLATVAVWRSRRK